MLRLLTDQQEEYVWQYIVSNGVVEPTLQADLHDHCCCLIEHLVIDGFSFTDAFAQVSAELTATRLGNLQSDQSLLLSNPSQQMKKLFYAGLFLTAFFINTGSLFKWMHWPGSGAIMFAGFAILLFLLLPIIATMTLKGFRQNSTIVNVRILAGLAGGSLTAIGWLFKFMSWIPANVFFMSGMVVLNVVFLPLFIYQMYQRSKLNYA